MLCKNCGNQLREDARFCVVCGCPVAEEIPVPVQEAVSEQEKETVVQEDAYEAISEPEVSDEQPTVETVEKFEEQETEVFVVAEKEEAITEQYDEFLPEQNISQEFVSLYSIANDPENDFVDSSAQIEPEYTQPSVDFAPAADSAKKLKKSLGSVLVIIAIVLYIAMIVLQLFGSFNPARADVAGTMAFFDEDFEQYGKYAEILFDYAPAFVSVGLIPALLILAGMCINTTQAYRRSGFASTGFSLIKSALIIKIVLSGIATVAAAALMVFANPIIKKVLSKFKDSEKLDEAIADATKLGIIIFAVLALCALVSLVHGIIALITANKMKKVFSANQQPKKFIGIRITSCAMVVINVIKLAAMVVLPLANTLIYDILSKIDTMPHYARNIIGEMIEDMLAINYYNIVSVVMLIGAYILFSINISKYAKKIA